MTNYTDALTYEFSDMNSAERLRELILYISDRCTDDKHFGVTKLNKILLMADFYYYANHGKPITGVSYFRLPNGPAPQPMARILDDMQTSRDIAIKHIKMMDFAQHRVIALREANLDIFTASEIAFVETVIGYLWDRTAREVSELSHGIAWKVAQDKEVIPYEAVFLLDEELTPYDINRTQELIRQHGWNV